MQMEKVGIYKITSPSGRVYIGQSRNLPKRKKCYTAGRCTHQRVINNSIKKYGHKSHIFEIIHVLPIDVEQHVLDTYEVLYYNQYKSTGHTMMNLKECGNGGGKHSLETRNLIGEISKERFRSTGDYEIYQYDKNLNLVKIWNVSILDISKQARFQSPSIGRSLEKNTKGKFKMAHESFWFYKKDLDRLKEIDRKRIKYKNNQYGGFWMYW